jgi:hypothetical protein
MTTKADFDEQEWDAIQKSVTGAGMLASLSDRDFTDSFGEASAMAKYLGKQRSESPSALVRDIAGVHKSGFGLRTSPEELETATVTAIGTARTALGAKAPEEVGAYRELVLGVAQAVAEAKGGGVSDQERAAIEKVRAALDAS